MEYEIDALSQYSYQIVSTLVIYSFMSNSSQYTRLKLL